MARANWRAISDTGDVMPRISDLVTTLSTEQAIAALDAAHSRVICERVDAPTLAVLTAQTALETGHWRSMHCFCFGNIKGKAPHTGNFCMFPCNERLTEARAIRELASTGMREATYGIGPDAVLQSRNPDGTCSVKFWPANPQCIFRAYKTAAEGAADYIEFLAIDTTPNNGKPNRYETAWQAAEGDDPSTFVRELAKSGYFTANVDTYHKAIMQLYRQFLPLCQAHLQASPEHVLPAVKPTRGIDSAAVMARVAQTLAHQSREYFDGDPLDDTEREA